MNALQKYKDEYEDVESRLNGKVRRMQSNAMAIIINVIQSCFSFNIAKDKKLYLDHSYDVMMPSTGFISALTQRCTEQNTFILLSDKITTIHSL